MNTATQLKEALKINAKELANYQDVPVAELISNNELSTFYRLREDRVLLLKALEQFGDFLARRECQLKLEEAKHALKWLGKLKKATV